MKNYTITLPNGYTLVDGTDGPNWIKEDSSTEIFIKSKICECGKEKFNFMRHLEFCDLYE